jgi:predicted esterase
MATKLLAFHGYTLNGAEMRKQLGALAARFGAEVELVCPDAPHACDPAGVDRLYAAQPSARTNPPHLTWWNASDDGSIYRGWEETCDVVRAWMGDASSVGLLGFSQGAMLVAALAALSDRGELAPVRFAVMIAGRLPRAAALQPLFDRPIRVPSLHVWGDADRMTGPNAPALVERFDAATRKIARWAGPHVIPTRGHAADAIVDFVRESARDDQ